MPSQEPSPSKRELRKVILAARERLSEEMRARLSGHAKDRLLPLPCFQQAKTILFFRSFGTEIDTGPMMAGAREAGKRVVLPRIAPERRLDLCEVRSEADLEPGPMGILQPGPNCPLVPDAEIDLVIVPAVAWDGEGYRTGYGGGYYDRLLERLPQAVTVGIGFELQVVERVPREPHDRSVELLVTDREVRGFDRKREAS
jgi:5-formyltetrahydrofolate cyclo-ligase